MTLLTDILNETLFLYNEMAVYLLFGFFLGGLIYAFLPQNKIKQAIGRGGFLSSLKASLLGVPLPICSCGVVPTALSIKDSGASRGAVVSFLISTPQTGVDSIAATYSLMGPIFAVFRPVVAFITGTLGGFVTDASSGFSNDNGHTHSDNGNGEKTFSEKLFTAYRYGFHQLLGDIAKWIVLGIILGGIISALVPDGFFEQTITSPVLAYLAVLVFSIPLYVCATGSIPIATALLMKGLSPGAAFVLLMAGPATNAASLVVLLKTIGKKDTVIYLISIIAGSVAGGIVFDIFFMDAFQKGFSALHHSQEGFFYYIKITSSIILGWFLLKALLFKPKEEKQEVNYSENACVFSVSGMNCNHCKMTVENTALSVEGVEKVDVVLESEKLIVEGSFEKSMLVKKIEDKGYKVTGFES